MISLPVVSAVLTGSPDVALDVVQGAGGMVLDDTAVPHVQGSIVVNLPGAYALTDSETIWAQGFETDQSGVSNFTRSNVSGNYRTGAYGAVSASIAAATTGTMSFLTFSGLLVAGRAVQVHVWARTSTGTRTAYLTNSFATGPSVTLSTTWQELVLAFTPTSASSFVTLGYGAGSAAMTLVVDDITVRGRDLTWVPDTTTYAALDSRLTKRIKVTTSATYVTGGSAQTRLWDLLLVDRDVDTRAATITLTVHSDEALLNDAANASASDDTTPFTYASSLRSIVNYGLGKIGASLAATPTDDADMTPYWSLSNRVSNPRANSTTGYAASGNTSAVGLNTSIPWEGSGCVVWNSAASGPSYLQVTVEEACKTGDVFTGSAYFRSADSSGRTGRVMIRFLNAGGTVLLDSISAGVAVSTGAYARISQTATAPAGATRVQLYMREDATAATQQFAVDGVMLTEGARLVPFFSGSSSDAFYTYTWAGTTDASVSTRTPVTAKDPDALTIRPGVSVLAFLSPLVQVAGLRLVCDESRVWTLRSNSYLASGSLEFRQSVNLYDAADSIDRRSGYWYDAAVVRYSWRDTYGVQQERFDYYGLSGSPVKTMRFEKTTPYPGPGLAQYYVTRAQTVGRELTLTAAADWTAKAEEPLRVYLDATPVQLGKASRVAFDFAQVRMTVTTRTTDTPAGAIDLAVGTINAASGTIG